jgi:hypothetical protein
MKTTKYPSSDEDSQGVLEEAHIRFLVDASVSNLRGAVSGDNINIAEIDSTVAEQGVIIAEQGVKITKQDVIIAEQGVKITKQDVIIAEQGVRIDNLVSTVSDMSTELKPLRLRQLIEEGRKYFWKKYGPGYSTKYSDKLDSGSYYDFDSETYFDHTSPKQWGHFVTYSKNISGNAIYWKLLVGGGQSEFTTLSDTVHSADAYTIARIIVKVEPLLAYKELFNKIFEMSVDQALAKGSQSGCVKIT